MTTLLLLTACGGGVVIDDTSTTTDSSGYGTTDFPEAPELVINEFMASNASTVTDAAGAYPDWVEIYNATDQTVDLEGWRLTDDLEDKTKWVFPAGTLLAAYDHVVVWCDSDVDEEGLHTSWELDKAGEQIGLSASGTYGGVLVDAIEYDSQATDISMARMPDASTNWEADPTPTPWEANQ